MVLSIIVNVAYADKFDSQEEANAFVMQAQNFLICLEMHIASSSHLMNGRMDIVNEKRNDDGEYRNLVHSGIV